MKATLRELAETHFYGAIEIKLEDGRIVLIRKTENYKPPLEKPGYARTQKTEPATGASILDLIGQAVQNPAKPIMEGLFHECETAGLHGSQELFKRSGPWSLQSAGYK